MTDFLLELRSEEIPARMQAGARADLEKLFTKELAAAGLKAGEITVWSTPRRLALIARDLPLATQAVSEEVKGPRTSAPEQALEGFLRKTGLTKDHLVERDGVWFAVIEKPGRATKDVLAQAIPAIIRAFPWPKSQRWGSASISTESIRWVRPLSGIVAILGEDLIECELGGVTSGYATRGHRFHHDGEITIGGANDYAEKLRACHVIVDHAEREAMIRDKAKAAAEAAGLVLVEDEGLVIENAGLTEWPVPLLGRFDEAFLDVPPEVIQLTARINQKYFVCEFPSRLREGLGEGLSSSARGELANAFVCTANIEATDGGAAIIDGNRKVLAARLSDARFFWEQDKKKPLSEHAEKLSRITFHEKLGTVADKVERVAKLARWLVEEGIIKPSPLQGRGLGEGAANAAPADILSADAAKEQLANQAELAARLCKADLVTEMVGEFPELQGLMGGYYARAEGAGGEHKDAVADAIRDHYKPVGQGDDVPTAPVTVAVALADKLDTISHFFLVDERPTGSKDPFALRRAILGIIALTVKNALRFDFGKLFDQAVGNASSLQVTLAGGHFISFVVERLKVQQREAGVRHDLIDAIVRIGGDDEIGDEKDLVRLLARVHALQAFVTTEDGTNLLAGYKRAANILKKEEFTPVDADYVREPAEQALIDALNAADPLVDAAIAAEDFTAAMAALASLRAPIDAFFEAVMINDPDAAKRSSRLALLDHFRAAVHKVADFSYIEG